MVKKYKFRVGNKVLVRLCQKCRSHIRFFNVRRWKRGIINSIWVWCDGLKLENVKWIATIHLPATRFLYTAGDDVIVVLVVKGGYAFSICCSTAEKDFKKYFMSRKSTRTTPRRSRVEVQY